MFRYLSLIIVMLMSSYAYAQWPGDECTDAMAAFEGPNSFDTSTATASSPVPSDTLCQGTYLNWTTNTQDVWMVFSPMYTGVYEISTCDASSFDTSIVLYMGGCDENNQIACNGDSETQDKSCQAYYSRIETTLTQGEDYYIRIGGYDNAFGTGTLTITNMGGGNDNYIWYVNEDASGQGDGKTWEDAFNHPQDALDVVSSGEQIWVARGTYKANDYEQSNDPRESSFRMVGGVSMYGGFLGNEENLNERNPEAHITLLTGDLYGNDEDGDTSDNAYHVVRFQNLVGSGRTILDGFVISAGNADIDPNGGGILVDNVDTDVSTRPIVDRCKIELNAAKYGAGVYVTDSAALSMTFCVITHNNAQIRGGAILSWGELQIQNCLIAGNHADSMSGAIDSPYWGTSTIRSSTIVQNTASQYGCIGYVGGTIKCYNSILWGNRDFNGNNLPFNPNQGIFFSQYSCVEFVGDDLNGSGNTATNPRFVDEFGPDGEPATGDERFRLLQQSPLIDAGDNFEVYTQKDIAGNDRLIDDPYMQDTGQGDGENPIVDFGALEHVPNSGDVGIWNGSANSNFNNPKNWWPYGYPDIGWTGLFNVTNPQTLLFDQNTYVDRLIISSGEVTFDLTGQTMQLYATENPLLISQYGEPTSATFKGQGGSLLLEGDLNLEGGNIFFEDGIVVDVGEVNLSGDTEFAFDGTLIGDMHNQGGIMPAGRQVGQFTLDGSLNPNDQTGNSPELIGRLTFDIQGGIDTDYDHISILKTMGQKTALQLRWGGDYTPNIGDAYNIIDAGINESTTSLIYATGLPRGISCNWSPPGSGLLDGGDDVTIVTTGPVEFDGVAAQIISNTPNAYTILDVDGENGPDIAMTVSADGGGDGEVVIFLNNGVSGSWQGFTEQVGIAVGVDPMDIEHADFNGDGTANDLVVANHGDDSVTVLLNDGSGSFTVSEVSTDASPRYIAVGDYVEDANDVVDIAVACDSLNTTVLQNIPALGAMGATWTNVGSLSTPLPADIDPGDVNNDKDLDFVLLNGSSDGYRVLEGNGAGGGPFGFVFDDPLVNGSDATELEFSDLNGDGFDDAVTVNHGNGTMSVLLGDGSELGAASSFAVGTEPESTTIADFDNDGDDDMVVSVIGDVSGERELQVIRNDTDTTLTLIADQIAGSGDVPTMVEHADIDADGLLDVVSIIDVDHLSGSAIGIGVYLNISAVVVDCEGDIDGDGTVAVTDLLEVIAAWGTDDPDADVNSDGSVDVTDLLIVVANWGPCD